MSVGLEPLPEEEGWSSFNGQRFNNMTKTETATTITSSSWSLKLEDSDCRSSDSGFVEGSNLNLTMEAEVIAANTASAKYTSFTDKNSTNTSTKKSGTIPTTTKMIKQVTKPLFGLVKHHVSCRFQISDLADGNNSEIAEELEVDPFSSLPPTMSSLMVPSAFTSFGAFDHQPSSMPNSPFHGSLTRKHRLSKMSSLNRESSQRSVSSAASFIC